METSETRECSVLGHSRRVEVSYRHNRRTVPTPTYLRKATSITSCLACLVRGSSLWGDVQSRFHDYSNRNTLVISQ